MLTLTGADWKNITEQRLAIRMGRTTTDVVGHAYGMYETVSAAVFSKMSFAEKLKATMLPANWYDRLFNTMSLMMDFAVGNPEVTFLLLIRNTVRCDEHWFNATGLSRGDGASFPRVNLQLIGGAPAVVSNYFFDSPHPVIRTNETRMEALCDQVIRMIKAVPPLE